MVGAAAILVVVVLVVMMRGGDAKAGTDGEKGTATPVVTPASRPTPVQAGETVSGKTPDRAAPALGSETLAELDRLLAEAKVHYNEGVTKRNAGDNAGARAAQAKAKKLLDEWEGLVVDQLAWQEEAELGGWAQPAEYELLTRRYPGFSSLQKKVRMGGGK